jgi:U3 small nucleolar RNA-associated protein 20
MFEPEDEELSSDEDEPEKPLHVSGSTVSRPAPREPEKKREGKVAHWRPSALKSSKTSKDAATESSRERNNLRRVQDGAAAPKLTGSSRFTAVVAAASRINDPSNIGAVVFSLRLLYSVLKKNRPKSNDPSIIAIIDPFVPLLTACVCASRETDIVLLSLRCLGLFLYLDLPSKEKCNSALSSKTLELLSSAGVGSNGENELSQACFKMLTVLMNIDQSQSKSSDRSSMLTDGEQAFSKSATMPLDSEQMRVLMSFLQEAITDSENHNAALNLLRAIMSRRFVSPEFYDLMEAIIDQSVRSHKAALRQVCSCNFGAINLCILSSNIA